MPQLLWDASALAKRYANETGSDTVDLLFDSVPALPMVATLLTYAETAASLRRKFNQGVLSRAAFNVSRVALRHEVLGSAGFPLLTIEDSVILSGIGLIDRHNLNASDAAILAAYLRYTHLQGRMGPSPVLVASDQRLLRAARAEGLAILDPEVLAVADVPAFLATL